MSTQIFAVSNFCLLYIAFFEIIKKNVDGVGVMAQISFLPERLAEIRTKAGLTSKEAAARCGMDPAVYWRYEKGQTQPTYPALFTISLSLNTSIDYLCGRTDNPAPTIIPVADNDKRVMEYLHKYKALTSGQQEAIQHVMDEFLDLNG